MMRVVVRDFGRVMALLATVGSGCVGVGSLELADVSAGSGVVPAATPEVGLARSELPTELPPPSVDVSESRPRVDMLAVPTVRRLSDDDGPLVDVELSRSRVTAVPGSSVVLSIGDGSLLRSIDVNIPGPDITKLKLNP